jgi:hypothetical protein
MRDINKLSKEMTRSEFMNWYEDVIECNECPSYFGLDDDRACEKFIGNCVDCMEEAIKDIKFLGER